MADINGDGFGDLFVGQPRGATTRNPGAVFVFRGTEAGLFSSAPTMVAGFSPRDMFGLAMANVGDLNGDGLSDLVIGAPEYSNGEIQEGAFFLMYGRRDGEPLRPDFHLESAHIRLQLALSVAAAGDVNGDGFGDVLVGAPRHPVKSHQEGVAYLYLGSATGLVARASWACFSHQREAHCGQAVACAGDVNRDGYSDVLVGMPDFDTSQPDAGRVLLFLGSRSGLKETPDWSADGPHAHGRFGAALAQAGDLNGDGYDDVLVGAPGVGDQVKLSGWVFAYFGNSNGLAKAPAWAVSDGQDGAQFGNAIAALGDINGDQHLDIVVGAPGFDGGYPNQGRVCLFLGTKGGVLTTPDWTVEGGQPGAECGGSVASASDINRDGLNDFLVAAPAYSTLRAKAGRVDVFLGSRTVYRGQGKFPADGTNSVALPRQAFNPSIGDRSEPVPPLPAAVIYLGGVGLVLAFAVGFILWRRKSRANLRQERQRFARDLHDDLGAKLTSISVLGELVRREAASTEAGRRNAQLLTETAREVLESMEQVIWSVNPANDTLENLVVFIVQYAGPFLAPSGIELHPESPATLPDRPLPAHLRKSVFLSVKEALNNVVKHAGATQVGLRIRYEASALTIVIEDNGRGLRAQAGGESETAAVGSDGLKNMRERMREAGGTFAVEAGAGGGTRVTLQVRV